MLRIVRHTGRTGVLTFCVLLLPAGLLVGQVAVPGTFPTPGTVPASETPAVPRCKPPCVCIPNVKGYGYFKTSWRDWNEPRLDKTFPAAVGKEVIPTPTPQPKPQIPVEEVPAPKAMEAPAGEQPQGTEAKTPEKTKGGEGILMPPGTLELNPKSPGLPGGLGEPAEGNPPSGILPPLQGGLPGLQPEPKSRPEERSPAPAKQPPAEKAQPETPPGELESPAPPSAPTKSGAEGRRRTQGPSLSQAGTVPIFAARGHKNGTVPLSAAQARGNAQSSHEAPEETIQADWTRSLAPSSRSELGQRLLADASTQQIRPVDYQRPLPQRAEGDSPQVAAPVQNQVFEQPVGQATNVAERVGHVEDAPVALDGYCPVELTKNENWVKGDARWTVVHQGVTYMFSSPVQRECFLVEPERYVPVCSGSDPVLLAEQRRHVPGRLENCVLYEGRLYMFSGPSTLAQFRQDPRHYAAAAAQP